MCEICWMLNGQVEGKYMCVMLEGGRQNVYKMLDFSMICQYVCVMLEVKKDAVKVNDLLRYYGVLVRSSAVVVDGLRSKGVYISNSAVGVNRVGS